MILIVFKNSIKTIHYVLFICDPQAQMNTEHRMSLREKNLYKRRVNKEHNSNFRAGYVSINEEQLHKTGIRGRKRYLIYLVTCLVIAAVVVNILVGLSAWPRIR